MASIFKRNYDNGTVTLPEGKVISVLALPANSMNYFAVYGFIRACQDPTGSIKDDVKREEAALAIAESLISGVHERKTRAFGETLDDKLDEANAQLIAYDASSDSDKRFAASLGVNRTGIMNEIKRLEKAIAKRDAKVKVVPTPTVEINVEE